MQRNPVRSADFLLTASAWDRTARRSLFELHASWSRETRAGVQRLLEAYGFYRGRVDGNFDPPTFVAPTAFAQQDPVQAAPYDRPIAIPGMRRESRRIGAPAALFPR